MTVSHLEQTTFGADDSMSVICLYSGSGIVQPRTPPPLIGA